MTASIDAVIFDFAGVLTTSPAEVMAKKLTGHNISFEDALPVMLGPLEADGDHPWHQIERGEITLDQYNIAIEPVWRAAGFSSFPSPPNFDEFAGAITAIVEMVEAARRISAAGFKTAILSNNIREWQGWQGLVDAPRLVDDVIDSSEVGLRKPDPAIYKLTLERLGGVAPERSLFIDDFPWNIDGAKALGMQTRLANGSPETAASLLELLNIA